MSSSELAGEPTNGDANRHDSPQPEARGVDDDDLESRGFVTLDRVRRAWAARDPAVVELVRELLTQPPPPDPRAREGEREFAAFVAEIRAPAFLRKPPDEQKAARVAALRGLEAPDAGIPIPDKFRIHEILMEIWNDGSPFARETILGILRTAPPRYGAWRAVKRVFKDAEQRDDFEVLGTIVAAIDGAGQRGGELAPGNRTLAYLKRRAWRKLRRLGIGFPAAYPDAAAEVLAAYDDDTPWARTWVANHIFYHNTKAYKSDRFRFKTGPPKSRIAQRAFDDLWKRSPRPLFSLLERARSDAAREFAVEGLKRDFGGAPNEIEPEWIARLIRARVPVIHAFVVWLLRNARRFEQGAFRELGLHEPILELFESPCDPAREYAAEYARARARDLPLDRLLRLANNSNKKVRELAFDLLGERDPRTGVGLDNWARLLGTEHGHEPAARIVAREFSAKELAPRWLADVMFRPSEKAFEFAVDRLARLHPPASLGPEFLLELFDRAERLDPDDDKIGERVIAHVTEKFVQHFDPNAIDPDALRRMLLDPAARDALVEWTRSGKLKPARFGLDFLRALAHRPTWERFEWARRRRSDPERRRSGGGARFDPNLAAIAMEWMRDVRAFDPAELGRDWLLELAVDPDPETRKFAVAVMIKGFLPADFAPRTPATGGAESESETKTETETAAEIAVDFGGASFLFTGKLASMDRKSAEGKVKAANGTVASGVTAKLHHLVIGDEGSPLYGQGRKGSKQVKAEELNAAGANIRVISETAFLKMLGGRLSPAVAAPAGEGGAQGPADDATRAGCERLWEMAMAGGPDDAPLARFALEYLRRHHPAICLEETDRPVDPGAEIPPWFLDFARVKPLLLESRRPQREFALKLARHEFARWNPSGADLVELCECPHQDTRDFVALALLAPDAPEHRAHRVDPGRLTSDAVHGFCESTDERTRGLGMRLIERDPRFRSPEELFKLAESPDRRVRGLVVRTIAALYREQGLTRGWKPFAPEVSAVGVSAARARKMAEEAARDRGAGVPERPAHPPAPIPELREFLRRMLFEVPPGRATSRRGAAEEARTLGKLRPLSARRAKLALVETIRDLGVEDRELAAAALPALEEFLGSRGETEKLACLVAVTRLRRAHPDLDPDAPGTAPANSNPPPPHAAPVESESAPTATRRRAETRPPTRTETGNRNRGDGEAKS